jgi:hypothetical protein
MALLNGDDDGQMAKTNKYRNVFFNTVDGRDVLHDMALECCHFETPSSEAEIALQNFFKYVLFNCGVLHDGTTREIIDKYAQVNYNPKSSKDLQEE